MINNKILSFIRLFSTELISKTAFLFLSIIIARTFSNSDYGRFAFVQSLILPFFAFFDLGIATLATRDIAYNKSHEYFFIDYGISYKLITTILGLVSISAVVSISKVVSSEIYLVIIFTTVIVVNSFSEFIKGIQRGRDLFKYESIANLIQCLIALAIGLVYIGLDLSIEIVSTTYIFGAICGLIVMIFFMSKSNKKLKFKFNSSKIKYFFVEGWPFAGVSALRQIYFQIDQVLLSLLVGSFYTGIYAKSYLVYAILVTFVGIITKFFFPKIIKLEKSKKFKSIYRLLILFFIGSLICSLIGEVILSLWGEKVMYLLFKVESFKIVLVMKVLLMGFPFRVLLSFLGSIIAAKKKQRIIFFVYIVVSLFNILTNVIVIPKYFAVGAAFTTLLSEILLFLSYLFIFLKGEKSDIKRFKH